MEAIVLEDEDMERPPHVGIGQWATLKRKAGELPETESKCEPHNVSPSSSALESTQESRQHKASACLHLPMAVTVKRPECGPRTRQGPQRQPTPHPIFNGPENQTQYPIAVCKNGAHPTNYCGRYSKELNDPPIKGRGTGRLKCPRCNCGYRRIDTVRKHFQECIALNGNPNCLAWTDHDSYADGVAARNSAKIDGGLKRETRKTIVKGPRPIIVSVSEFAIRTAMLYERHFNRTTDSELMLPPSSGTKEEEDRTWQKIKKDLKNQIRTGQGISAEDEKLIHRFKDEGSWDSLSSDET